MHIFIKMARRKKPYECASVLADGNIKVYFFSTL